MALLPESPVASERLRSLEIAYSHVPVRISYEGAKFIRIIESLNNCHDPGLAGTTTTTTTTTSRPPLGPTLYLKWNINSPRRRPVTVLMLMLRLLPGPSRRGLKWPSLGGATC